MILMTPAALTGVFVCGPIARVLEVRNHTWRSTLTGAVLALVLCSSVTAHARRRRPARRRHNTHAAQPVAPTPAPAPAPAADPTRTQALELFRVGAGQYRARRFADALATFEQAYALQPEPVLLYNIARTLEALRRDDEAIERYEQFLEHPEAPANEVATAQSHLQILRTAQEQRQEAERRRLRQHEAEVLARVHGEGAAGGSEADAEMGSVGAEAAPGRSNALTVLGISMVIAGVGAGGYGGYAMYDAQLTMDQARNAPSQLETATLAQRASDQAILGDVLVIGGAAVLVVGFIVVIAN